MAVSPLWGAVQVTIAVSLLLAGPKILLLLPVWLIGVWLYRHLPRWGEVTAATSFLLTAVLALAMIQFDLSSCSGPG